MDVLQPSGLPRASWRTFCGSGRTHAEPGPRSRSLVAQLAGPPGRRAKVVFGGHRADQWRGAFDLQNITQMTVQGSNLTQRESFLLPQEFFFASLQAWLRFLLWLRPCLQVAPPVPSTSSGGPRRRDAQHRGGRGTRGGTAG